MRISPEHKVAEKALLEIKILTDSLNSENTNKLVSELGDLEGKISALRSFIFNHLIRNENKRKNKKSNG